MFLFTVKFPIYRKNYYSSKIILRTRNVTRASSRNKHMRELDQNVHVTISLREVYDIILIDLGRALRASSI